MANVLVGVTGSVAAIRTPLLYQSLVQSGHAVKVVATNPALYFFDPAELPTGVLHVDADEWPGRERGGRYQRDDPVLHIELRRWADLFLIAPLDANTLAKLANGLSDNCLTCVWRAWDPARPVILAPAMNTYMWESPVTKWHFGLLLENAGRPFSFFAEANLELIIDMINQGLPNLQIVPPTSKQLACGDVGVGAMAEVPKLVEAVERLLRRSERDRPEVVLPFRPTTDAPRHREGNQE
jgi:phosphopantothenoylcysteine decarboxylase